MGVHFKIKHRAFISILIFIIFTIIFFRDGLKHGNIPVEGDVLHVIGRVGFVSNNFGIFHYEDMRYVLSPPLLLFQVILSKIFGVFTVIQVTYIILLSLGYFGMYKLISKYIFTSDTNGNSKWVITISSTTGGLTYAFNPTIIDAMLRGHVQLVFGFELFPWIAYLLLSLNSNLTKTMFLSTAMVLFLTSTNPSFILMSFQTITALLLLGFMIHKNNKAYFKSTLLVASITLTVSAPYFFTLYNLKVPWLIRELQKPLETYYLYSNKNLLEAFTGVCSSPGISLPLSRQVLLILPILAFSPTLVIPKSKLKDNRELCLCYVCLAFVALFNILMSMGPHAPVIGDILASIFEKYPFFRGLRSSHRFSDLVYFAYSFLIALSIYHVSPYVPKLISQIFGACNDSKVRILTSIMLLGVLILSYMPVFMYGYKVAEYPSEFDDITKLLIEKENNNLLKFYILVVPNYDLSSSIIRDYVFNKSLPKNVPFNLLRMNGLKPTLGGQYKEVIRDELIRGKVNLTFLAKLGIKYILVDKGKHFKDFKYVEQMKNSILSKNGVKIIYEDNVFVLAENTLYKEKNAIGSRHVENWIRVLGKTFYLLLCLLLVLSLTFTIRNLQKVHSWWKYETNKNSNDFTRL